MKQGDRMMFIEQLRVHKGGLIRLKTQLFWYGGRGWDGSPGRVCILLDVVAVPAHVHAHAATATVAPSARDPRLGFARRSDRVGVHLLIDGQAYWVWVDQDSSEMLNDAP